MRLPHLAAALVPLSLTVGVLAGVKEIWWNITYVEGANPDGLFERRVVGVNDTWPYVNFLADPGMISHVSFLFFSFLLQAPTD